VDRASRIVGIGWAKRFSVRFDRAERAARSNVLVYGEAAVVGFE
jgi:hypothetical protein